MFVLFVDMKLKPGAQAALEKTYTEVFRPAISRQEGFRGVELLRPNQAGDQWRLSLAFESHELQKKWVGMDLHQEVWPQMESHFADYSVNDYTAV
ncbi:MAG TPA: antibiotic biosynthesis monooxygenase [Acidobacteriaceae bacterium]|jgi:heme-degrading monooxygenase HmoA|nr:antibiotic biosynthesis monooxygenase [Acidobacteriaceae bacterium]